VVFGQIDRSLQRLMSTAASSYPAGVPLSEILEQ
jgi:hypothetical protein